MRHKAPSAFENQRDIREFIEIYVNKELKKFPWRNLLPLLPASTVVTLLNYLNTHNNSLEHKYFHSTLSLNAESCC